MFRFFKVFGTLSNGQIVEDYISTDCSIFLEACDLVEMHIFSMFRNHSSLGRNEQLFYQQIRVYSVSSCPSDLPIEVLVNRVRAAKQLRCSLENEEDYLLRSLKL